MKINIPYITALALAAIGAAVSLYGLVAMFGLAFLPVGAGLEAGKLTAAAALHRSWRALGWRVRYALSALVVALMILTSSGIYGFTLSRYLAHVAEITGPVSERIAAADQAIERQAAKVADLDKQITAIDAAPAIDTAIAAKPRNAAAIAAQAKAQAEAVKLRLADEQRRQAKRDALTTRRDAETAELARLRTERAAIGSQQKAAEAEVGPVKILADAIGVDPGKVVAAAVASIYDALCVLLLIAAGHKPATAAAVKPPARRKSSRSEASRKGWETRRRKAAAYKRGPVVVK
jgi:hypothetical protein